jgi:regulatory protein
MGIISTLEPLARNKKRVRVFVDEECWGIIGAALLRERGYQPGSSLDTESWQALLLTEVPAALDQALYYLGMRSRTRREMERYLKTARRYEESIITRVMAKLDDYGYLDDEALAARAVESLSAQGQGRGAIERKLLLRGLDKGMIRQALEVYAPEDEEENALTLARRFYDRYAGDDPGKRLNKTAAALARRGFSWDSISRALNQLKQPNDIL